MHVENSKRFPPDRNLALELVRVTEAAAIAGSKWVGRGQKESGDGAAVDAMRHMISSVSMQGTVVIGEGEKDHAPMLYNGEQVGNGDGALCDVAVDPIDGTTQMAKGMPNSLSIIAVSERNSMYDPSAVFYMNKLVVGPEAVGLVDINAPVADNLKKVAKAKEKNLSEITVCVLDRPRHENLIKEIRSVGAKVKLISDGDVAGAIAVAQYGSKIDLLMGIGGTPEGIITAAAMICAGGEIQGVLYPINEQEKQKLAKTDYKLGEVLTTKQLCSGDNIFVAATGVTDGELLKGVSYLPHEIVTESLVMRSQSGTLRNIISRHNPKIIDKRLGKDF